MSKRAIVTGGGRGIGAAIAAALDKQGYDLVLMGRNSKALEQTAATLQTAEVRLLDVTDPTSVAKAFEGLDVEVLINNAGAVATAPLEKTDLALWQQMLAVNLTGAFLCTRKVLPTMKQRKAGRIVNVASTASLKGYPYVSAYCAAKHGLVGLTRALALETMKHGITVNAVCPGYTETDLLENSVANIREATGRSDEDARAILRASNPQNRFIQPEEISACVVWLCSPEAAGVTGQAIAIAGGEVM